MKRKSNYSRLAELLEIGNVILNFTWKKCERKKECEFSLLQEFHPFTNPRFSNVSVSPSTRWSASTLPKKVLGCAGNTAINLRSIECNIKFDFFSTKSFPLLYINVCNCCFWHVFRHFRGFRCQFWSRLVCTVQNLRAIWCKDVIRIINGSSCKRLILFQFRSAGVRQNRFLLFV